MMHSDVSKASFRPERDTCKDHEDEELNYFCFECMSPPVCSECVIHGAHKSHDVKTIRKSYPIANQKLGDLVMHLGSKIDDLSIVEQKLDGRKRDIIDQTNTIKQQMSNAFEEIRHRLERKEREMLQQADHFTEQNLKEVDQMIRILNGRGMVLSQTINEIKGNMEGRDDCGLLDFFANNYAKIISGSESDLPQLKDISQQAQLKCNINTKSLNNFIEDLQGLQLEIQNTNAKMENLTPSLKMESVTSHRE